MSKVHRDRLQGGNHGSIIDLFCGVGGLSHGFFLEGFHIGAGVDVDPDCRYPYEANNRAQFVQRGVEDLTSGDLAGWFRGDLPRILVGCAPCQPFSTYNQKNSDPNWRLLYSFARLAEESLPDIVSMENVPSLAKFRGGQVLSEFLRTLEQSGYQIWSDIVYAPDYGVPQQRRRLVVLASRLGPISLVPPTHRPEQYRTVTDAIGELPPVKAGEFDAQDRLHKASALSELNLRRIRASRPGGTWRDWDTELRASCHAAVTGRGYGAVYGRMRWDTPAPTITTQFYGYGSGRFGHPEQDRALTLREGAILQSFPRGYKFAPPEADPPLKSTGKLIGNAVPVGIARAIATSIKEHLRSVTSG